jgi:hypothetical protein
MDVVVLSPVYGDMQLKKNNPKMIQWGFHDDFKKLSEL